MCNTLWANKISRCWGSESNNVFILKTAEHTCFQERRRVETCVLEEDMWYMCSGFGKKMWKDHSTYVDAPWWIRNVWHSRKKQLHLLDIRAKQRHAEWETTKKNPPFPHFSIFWKSIYSCVRFRCFYFSQMGWTSSATLWVVSGTPLTCHCGRHKRMQLEAWTAWWTARIEKPWCIKITCSPRENQCGVHLPALGSLSCIYEYLLQ